MLGLAVLSLALSLLTLVDARFLSGPAQLDVNYGDERMQNFLVEQAEHAFTQKQSLRDIGLADPIEHLARSKKPDEQIAAEARDFYTHTWYNPSCNIQCKRNDVRTPPLVIVSFDGFANRYRKRNLVPSLERMGECGARTTQMFPSYPSKTFPNHYTIATGLYPESHGIIDNSVYDPAISPKVEDVRIFKGNGYFKGEPIWSAAVRQGKRMFCLFYPGCSYNITGYNPQKDIKFGTKLNYVERINMVTDWLNLAETERPDLIMAYFDQPDETGHFKEVDHEVNLELMYVEMTVNLMLTTFQKNNWLDCVNLVVVSDHGMQTLNKKYYVDKMFNTKDMLVANGVVGRVYMAAATRTVDEVVDELKCKEPESYRVYDRKRVPTRYHYSKNVRVGDVILEGRPGTTFYADIKEDWSLGSKHPLTSDHGYDYLEENMRAVFFARGPNIKPRTQLPSFQNVELFNLFSDLLRLDKDVPTNGTDGFIDQVLYGINAQPRKNPTKAFNAVSDCAPAGGSSTPKVQACSTAGSCSADATSANSKLSACGSSGVDPSALFSSSRSGACVLKSCSVATLRDGANRFGEPTLVYEVLEGSKVAQLDDPPASNQPCSFVDERVEASCSNWTAILGQTRDADLEWHSLVAGTGEPLRNLNTLQFLLYKEFARGPFQWLQRLTRQYAKKYKKVGVLTAATYDFDMDGVADDLSVFWSDVASRQRANPNEDLRPTHVARLLIRCEDGAWNADQVTCRNSGATRFLAFALPNARVELNCLSDAEYLRVNTAKVRDLELLTDVQMFQDAAKFPAPEWVQKRINITEQLWPH